MKTKLTGVAALLLSTSAAFAVDPATADLQTNSDVIILGNNDSSNHPSEGVYIYSNAAESSQIQVLSSGAINLYGTTTMNGSASVTGGLTVSGNTNVLGSVYNTSGVYNIADSLNVDGAATFDSTVGVTGAATFSNTMAVSGNADFAAGVDVTAGGLNVTGATDLNTGLNVDGQSTLDATTIQGTTSVTGTTTINTLGAAGVSTSIGQDGNTTSILSNTISIGSTDVTESGYDTTIMIGTGGLAGATVEVGNDNSLTNINMAASNTILIMQNDQSISGVIDNTSEAVAIVGMGNNGASRVIADENGKIIETMDDTSGTTAAVVVQNSAGNTHGLVVQENKTTLSGGLNSSSMTLNDNGATFSNSANGAPIQVHGVADGSSAFDAVNVRQLYSGIAASLAAQPDMRLEPGKAGMALGLGSYGGYTAVGLGMGYMFDNGGVMSASLSKAPESQVAARASISWTW